MKSLLTFFLIIVGLQPAYASKIDSTLLGKWADSKKSCRGIKTDDSFRILSIKNSNINQIKDERYAGYSLINLNKFYLTPSNELYASGVKYTFHDEDEIEGNLYRERVKVHYILIDSELYSINSYISEDGKEETYTLNYIKCN